MWAEFKHKSPWDLSSKGHNMHSPERYLKKSEGMWIQPARRDTLTFISVVGTKFFIRPCSLNHLTLEKKFSFFLGTLFISFLVFHVTYEVRGLHTWEWVINYISLWIKANKSNETTYLVFGKQYLHCIDENLHAQKRLPWYLVDPQPGSVAPLIFVIAALPSNEKSCVSSIGSSAGLLWGNKWRNSRKFSCFSGFLLI